MKFNKNWNNKLFSQSFTTFRKYNPEAYPAGSTHPVELLIPDKLLTDMQFLALAARPNSQCKQSSTGFWLHVGSVQIQTSEFFYPNSISNADWLVDMGLPKYQALKVLKNFYPDLSDQTHLSKLVVSWTDQPPVALLAYLTTNNHF